MNDEPDSRQSIVPVVEQVPVVHNDRLVRVETVQVEEQALSNHLEPSKPVDDVVEAEWVIRYRAHRKRQWLRWVAAIIQMITALFVAYIFYLIPIDPSVGPFHNWKNPVIIFILICFIGKTLVDTLFYDHYQP